jgi:D-alanyl-lipoteichoic acid acyltransferase DltB (MBOAT superfamily)
MLYNSIPFLFFFASIYLLYWNLPTYLRKYILILGGMIFYANSSLVFLIHFLIVILINYLFLSKIRQSKSKVLLICVLVLNILNLGVFKYYKFFTGFMFSATGLSIFSQLNESIQFLFPLAISFYTFQVLAIQVDIYKGRIDIPINVFDFYAYMLFFPVLIAGPIMRYSDFFPTLQNIQANERNVYDATYLFMFGIIKKVLLADPLGAIVSPVFSNPENYSSLHIVAIGYVYLFQLFFDFSGLTDMARGVGLYLGFQIPENFKAPFFSRSLGEFWERWHITLSTWLKDYIFIPLGGSRVSEWRVYFNLILTMTLGGFWHGPDYTFIAWGAYWGIILSIERILRVRFNLEFIPRNFFHSVLKAFIVTSFGACSVLMFRASSTQNMIDIFSFILKNTSGEFTSKITNLESVLYAFVLFILVHVYQYWPERFHRLKKYDPYLVIVLGVITVFLLTTLSQDGNDFIYYKF